MDRVFESGAAGSPPSAPTSPSTGFPTGGNPTSAVPATKPGPYWFHMVTEEIRKVITDAGLTPSHTNLAQLSQAVAVIASASGLGHGNCYLGLDGANLRLVRQNGVKLIINGVVETIPSAGVTLAPTGTAANTLYYIYAFMNAGVMTAEWSTTGHSRDATTGVEIKTGDPTRSLIGMARTNASAAWVDSVTDRLVLSWFNRRAKEMSLAVSAGSTTSATFVELNTANRLNFLTWGEDAVRFNSSLYTTRNSSGGVWATRLTLNNAGFFGYGQFDGLAAIANYQFYPSINFNASEGYHFTTVQGQISGGVTLTLNGGGTSSVTGTIMG